MKQLLVIAIALASVNASASRARMTALGSSAHLVDTMTVYSNPADMMVQGDFVSFESGTTAGGAQNANAEGMITRSMGDSKFGLGLGHQAKNASIWGLRAAALTGVAGGVSQQNPVEFVYGTKMADWNVGGSLVYSNYNDKVNNVKESSGGLRIGGRSGALDVRLGLGLMNTFETAADKFKGTMGVSGGAGYWVEDIYYSGSFEMAGFKLEDAVTGAEKRKVDSMTITVGALQSIKKDGNELFYGVGLSNETRKVDVTGVENKTTSMFLPITLGMEVDAATWLTLRGSVTQSTLIANSKTETAGATTAETSPGLNTTVASVGAGLKFNKITVDGSLEGLTGGTQAQTLNANDFIAQVGVTYLF
jgi:hypothetical protein